MRKEHLVYRLADLMKNSIKINADLFTKLDVKRGLRNENGSGVLVGLTNIGNVVGYERIEDGSLVPCEGRLYYRGYEISDLVHRAMEEKRCAFEEVAYLLLSGQLPDKDELETFSSLIRDNMPLEPTTILNIIDLEGDNIMNILSRCVLEMYTFDSCPDDISCDNLMRQSIELMAKFPTIIAYAFNMMRYKNDKCSLHIRHSQDHFSLAENFLYMLKGSNSYTALDVRTLDLLLIVHAEHGGGNNSTFTVRVTSSTGTDTYSSIAAGIGSLKGPKHGGANLEVRKMIRHLQCVINDWTNENEILVYLMRMVKGEVYDKCGLIYGIGHAVYTLSDPRAKLLQEMARELAIEKGRLAEYEFMERLEKCGIEAIYQIKGCSKKMCANVDFYSGFLYELLGIPEEIYTPLFAMARIVGWCAHRNEELNFSGRRIIRPAYICVTEPVKVK